MDHCCHYGILHLVPRLEVLGSLLSVAIFKKLSAALIALTRHKVSSGMLVRSVDH